MLSSFLYRIAHLLADGSVETDKIKVELADHVVRSLRDMPEHKTLTTSWAAMLKAIRSEHSESGRQEKVEVAKTAVLLRMLACAAKLEAGDMDEGSNKKHKRNGPSSNPTNESLSQALLKALPALLTSFKTDHMSMRSLTKLPQYILPEIYSLSTSKSDFTALVKNLCASFVESTDEQVLNEIAKSLSLLVQGDHARVADANAQLKRVAAALQERLMELFAESDPDKYASSTPQKESRRSRKKFSRRSGATTKSSLNSDAMSSNTKETDVEHSICLCLVRWRVLLKAIPLSYLFDESEDDDENEVEGFCKTISEALGKRLMDRKPFFDEDESQAKSTGSSAVATVWKYHDSTIHAEVAKAIDSGLDVLLCILAWKLSEHMQNRKENAEVGVIDEDQNEVPGDHLVARLRDILAKLVGLCYEQFLDDTSGFVVSDEQEEFSSAVQTSAGRVASDLRTLFPREWSSAKDPTLRALAMTDDSHLIGGFVRYLHSRAGEFEEKDTKQDVALVKDLILPVARALTANWTHGNRKEAGVVLSHLTGSGKMVGQTVHLMARLLKKVRACLQICTILL